MTIDMQELIEDTVLLRCRINERPCEQEVEPQISLLELLRDQLRLTGTHMGCMTGHCGACTVLIDGVVAKSCLALAATLQGKAITSIEGLGQPDGRLSPLQQAFWDEAGLQCGFCAPGMLLTSTELLRANPRPSETEVRAALSGNLCRCTGYQSIVRAILAASRAMDRNSFDVAASGVIEQGQSKGQSK